MTSCSGGSTPILGRKRITLLQPNFSCGKIRPIRLYQRNRWGIVNITTTWNVLPRFSRNFSPAIITKLTTFCCNRWDITLRTGWKRTRIQSTRTLWLCCPNPRNIWWRNSSMWSLKVRILGQGYVKERLRSSLRKFYGRYGDLNKQYEVPLSRILRDILDDDHLQWHPPHKIFYPITDLDLITEFGFLPNCERFP